MRRLWIHPWTQLAILGLAALVLLLRPPAHPGQGLRASYWDSASRFDGAPDRVGVVRRWNLSMDGNRASSNQTEYAIRFEGYLDLPIGGNWGFALDSDDGSQLWLDGSLAVSNGGRHPRRRIEGFRPLPAGEHALRLEYTENIGESFLQLAVRSPGSDRWQSIPLAWMRPESRAGFDQVTSDRGHAIHLLAGWLALVLVSAAIGLRLWAMWPRLRTLKEREPRRAFARRLLGSPWFQDVMCMACCGLFYAQTIAVRLPVEVYMKGDSIYYAHTATSILRDFDLDQRNQTDERIFTDLKPTTNISLADSNISLGQHGEWYPKHPVLMPLLSVPLLALFGGVGLVIFNAVVLLLLVAVMRRVAARWASSAAAACAAVLIGLTPLFHVYAFSYCPDVLSSLFLVVGLCGPLTGWPLLGGLSLGLALWVKLPNALAIPLVLTVLGVRRAWRDLVRFGAGLGATAGAFAALNWYQFGAPWLTSYRRVWVVSGGTTRIGDHIGSFNRPFWDGFQLQLLDSFHGLLHTATAAVLAAMGYARWWRRDRATALAVFAFCGLTFLLYCKYDYTHASHFSNRFLMPVVALAAIPLACLLDQIFGVAAGGPRAAQAPDRTVTS